MDLSLSGINGINYDFKPYDIENTDTPSYFSTSVFGNDIIQEEDYQFNTSASASTVSSLRSEFETVKNGQGLIGKAWDGIKNFFGMKNGSNKVEETIQKAENGEITLEEAYEQIEKYKNGQEQSVDLVADVASGIASFASFSLATGVGLAAAPFTGGASLGLVAAGLGIAGASGAIIKAGIKGIDAAVGGREYDSLGYDLATGGINGIFAPITAGIGGAVGKSVAAKVGVNAVREGGEVLIKEGIKQTAKGALAKTLLTTNISYTGGTLLGRGLALGADMAVNGAITGGVDSAVRYLAGDEEEKTIEGLMDEVTTGTIGGAIASPIIGGGMRLAGNGIGKLTGKLSSTVSDSYSAAQRNLLNMPTVESPDTEFIKGLSSTIKSAEGFVDGVKIEADSLYDDFNNKIGQLFETRAHLSESLADLSENLGKLSGPDMTKMRGVLQDILTSDDIPEAIQKYAQKGIDLADFFDEKAIKSITSTLDGAEKYLDAVMQYVEKAETISDWGYIKLQDGLGIAQEGIDKAKEFTNTSAYKQLGDLPERFSGIYSSIKTEQANILDLANTIRNEIKAGNLESAAALMQDYLVKIENYGINLNNAATDIDGIIERAGFQDMVDILNERVSKRISSADFSSLSKDAQVQAIIEDSNIALPKFIQTMSSDENIPDEMRRFFKQFTSNCTVSRNMNEAQALADELYGAGKYTLKKSFGAGTIGETYLAETADGGQFVIKMLKEGVNLEKFEADRSMFTKYVEEFVSDPVEKEYKLKLINGLFDSWEKELDFSLEAQGAANMARNAQRYNVAQTLEVGTKNGQNISLVMEKADGVRLDSLLDMIQFAKQNPDDYLTKSVLDSTGKETNPWVKNADMVEQYSWLKDFTSWEEDLTQVFQKAQNEQVMFVSKSGTRTIHADPHAGNIFIDFNSATGKPVINYIDTGNTITRTSSDMLKDMTLTLNMLIGNSEGIVDYLLSGATLPSGANREELAKQMATMLDERLYKAGINLKSTSYTQDTFNSIMKELNIIPNVDDSNLMKATLQRIKTSREIASITGYGSPKSIDIKDLLKGLALSFKENPSETVKSIAPILKWMKNNDSQALETFFQMISPGTAANAANLQAA